WAEGVEIRGGPEFEQVEALRKAINRKNELYFYRWRPQNETYLFGFRKHEQGNNAREIPLFDPLVAEQEKEIARLKMPVPHVYELVKETAEPAERPSSPSSRPLRSSGDPAGGTRRAGADRRSGNGLEREPSV